MISPLTRSIISSVQLIVKPFTAVSFRIRADPRTRFSYSPLRVEYLHQFAWHTPWWWAVHIAVMVLSSSSASTASARSVR